MMPVNKPHQSNKIYTDIFTKYQLYHLSETLNSKLESYLKICVIFLVVFSFICLNYWLHFAFCILLHCVLKNVADKPTEYSKRMSRLCCVSSDVGHWEYGGEAGDVWLLEARVWWPAALSPLHVWLQSPTLSTSRDTAAQGQGALHMQVTTATGSALIILIYLLSFTFTLVINHPSFMANTPHIAIFICLSFAECFHLNFCLFWEWWVLYRILTFLWPNVTVD